jgi:hypothetical protein
MHVTRATELVGGHSAHLVVVLGNGSGSTVAERHAESSHDTGPWKELFERGEWETRLRDHSIGYILAPGCLNYENCRLRLPTSLLPYPAAESRVQATRDTPSLAATAELSSVIGVSEVVR